LIRAGLVVDKVEQELFSLDSPVAHANSFFIVLSFTQLGPSLASVYRYKIISIGSIAVKSENEAIAN
jgi:hypothetical protein